MEDFLFSQALTLTLTLSSRTGSSRCGAGPPAGEAAAQMAQREQRQSSARRTPRARTPGAGAVAGGRGASGRWAGAGTLGPRARGGPCRRVGGAGRERAGGGRGVRLLLSRGPRPPPGRRPRALRRALPQGQPWARLPVWRGHRVSPGPWRAESPVSQPGCAPPSVLNPVRSQGVSLQPAGTVALRTSRATAQWRAEVGLSVWAPGHRTALAEEDTETGVDG